MNAMPMVGKGPRRLSSAALACAWSVCAVARATPTGLDTPSGPLLGPPFARPLVPDIVEAGTSAFDVQLAWGLGARLSVGSHAELGGEFLLRTVPALGFGLRAERFGLFGPQPDTQPCECALGGEFAGAFAELRAWPGFVITPYGRVGGGYAAYVYEYWQDGPATEKRRAAGASMEGGLELHPGWFSLRVYGSLLGFVHEDREAPPSLTGLGLQLGFMHTLD